MRNLKLGTRLLVCFLAVGIIPLAVIGGISLYQSSDALSSSAFQQLVSVRNIKSSAVSRYFKLIENQVLTLSEDQMVVKAMGQFAKDFFGVLKHIQADKAKLARMRQDLEAYYKNQFNVEYQKNNPGKNTPISEWLAKLDDHSLVMQYLYIASNKNPLGSKDQLEQATDGSPYSALHGQVHHIIRNFLYKFGYYDIFLVEPQKGYVVYSVFKELDYATSLLSGPHANTNLGDSFRQALKAGQQGQANAVALVDYKRYPPSYEAPAGFIASPIMDAGKLIGVLVFQMPIDRLNAIMNEREGMGKTGETYLVGPDKLMRSDSFLDPQNHSVKASFANPDKGKVDTESTRRVLAGETGQDIIIDYNNNPVLSAYTPIKVGGLTWGMLAEIDEAEAFASVTALKYLVAITASVGIAVIVLISLFIGRSISKPINKVVESLGQSAEQVSSAAGQVASSSQSLAEGASQQAASIEETTASMEEMSSMTKTNAENASQADCLMKEAGSAMAKAGGSMGDLKSAMERIDAASDEMAKIIKTIDEIAFQTNLLALNAAVEAARAGEAGAGFAVVADEVRNLAMRAANAAKSTTELIEGNLSNIKSGSGLVGETGDAFDQMSQSANRVAELVAEIATASGEQTQGIGQINKAATEMDSATQRIASSAEESAAASEELSAQAEVMKGMVNDLNSLVKGAGSQSAANILAAKRGRLRSPGKHERPVKISSGYKLTSNKLKKSPEQTIPLEDDFADF